LCCAQSAVTMISESVSVFIIAPGYFCASK
jgi:hypothetical protein